MLNLARLRDIYIIRLKKNHSLTHKVNIPSVCSAKNDKFKFKSGIESYEPGYQK